MPNNGQRPNAVRFLADIAGGHATFHADGVLLQFANFAVPADRRPRLRVAGPAATLRVRFVGADPQTVVTATTRLPGVFNDYTGDDATTWRANLPTYAILAYAHLYPLIDLHYTGDDGNLKSTYTVAPGGDPTTIRWRYSGAQNIRLASSGDLVLTLPPVAGQPSRVVTETAPIAWQNVGAGRVDVGVRYTLAANGVISFALDAYDPTLPLVIDPTITTSPVSAMTAAYGIAVDGAGYRYVTGCSSAGARLSRFAPGSTTPLATTAFGDTADACGSDVAVTSSGQIIVAGSDMYSAELSQRAFVATWTNATATPVVTPLSTGVQAWARTVALHPTTQTAYVLWTPADVGLTQQGNRVSLISNGVPSSTVSVASGNDYAVDLAVDGQGVLYLSASLSGSFVVVKATMNGVVGSFPTTAIGTVLLDAANNVYVAGISGDFSTNTSFMRAQSLTASGQSRWTWVSTVQAGTTRLYDAALDSAGGLVLVGMTNADDFPRVGGVGIPRTNAMYSAFILRLNPNGAGIAYSDQFNATTNSTQGTQFNAIVLDGAGTAHFAGAIINNSNEGITGLVGYIPDEPPPPNKPDYPGYTVSYYEHTADDRDIYRYQGCRARQNGEHGIVVLAFGAPRVLPNGEYGARLFDTQDFPVDPASLTQIREAVKAFANAYYYAQDCARITNGDITVTNPAPANLIIAVGTSNSFKCIPDSNDRAIDPNTKECYPDRRFPNPDLTYQHGAAWAVMINEIESYLRRKGLINQVNVAGAYDAEPAWQDDQLPGQSQDWIEGYNAASMPDDKPVRPVYLFNSVDGGPRQGPPNRDWTSNELARLSEVYDLAFKLETARPLPQVYNFLYAKEWYQVRQYARINRHRSNKLISGVMTECGDAGCSYPFSTSSWTSYQTCSNPVPDLRPESGWRALYDTLHYTLIQDLTLNAPFLMTADLRVSPEKPITLAGDRTYDPCELIQWKLPNGTQRTLPSGTLLPVGTTFSYDLRPPGAVFNTNTQQPLAWSTDITSDIMAPRRTQ